jgi:hypothetical protein
LPATFLRHSDEQTVAGLAAVLHAIEDSGLSVIDFRDWGIVAAPSFLGRATLALALQQLAAEGAWGISPHFIPHRSQHAVSGTISQVLKIYGPNFGTGGGPGGMVDALLAGSVLLEANDLPGVWVVVTAWEPEAIPNAEGGIPADAVCRGLALALVPARSGWQGLRLRVLPGASRTPADTALDQPLPTIAQVQAQLTTLVAEGAGAGAVVWPLDGGGRIELGRDGADASRPRPAKVPWLANRARGEVQPSGAGTENKR